MLEETQALRLRAEPGFIDSGVNYRQRINFVVLDYRKKGERKGQKKIRINKKDLRRQIPMLYIIHGV